MALKIEKLKAPLIPGPDGAMDTNGSYIIILFGLRPTIYLHYIYENMLRMCSFTYHRGNLLTHRNGDRQIFVGIRKHFRDHS